MNTQTGSIKKYIIIIIAILSVVFLSQQAFSKRIGKSIISDITDKAGAYLAKGADWATSTIYPKISGEVQSRGDIISDKINQEKDKVSENILTKTKNYFSGIANSILHPGENNNCQTQPSQTPTNQ